MWMRLILFGCGSWKASLRLSALQHSATWLREFTTPRIRARDRGFKCGPTAIDDSMVAVLHSAPVGLTLVVGNAVLY